MDILFGKTEFASVSRADTETRPVPVFAVVLLHPVLLLAMSTDNYHIIQTCN